MNKNILVFSGSDFGSLLLYIQEVLKDLSNIEAYQNRQEMRSLHKVFFIVNPRSANKSTGKWWPSVLPSLDKAGFDYDWSFTNGAYTAPGIAAAALEKGYETIIAVGGDGTVYEVLNGIIENDRLRNPDTVFGVWPRGTGCDLARTLNLPREVTPILNMIKSGKTALIDAGRAFLRKDNGEGICRYFLNVAEAGLGGETAVRVNQTTKVLGGFFSFLWGALISAAVYKNKYMRIVLDDREIHEGIYAMVACGNGRYFGGGMEVCPEAVIDNGYLQVTALQNISKTDLFLNLPRVYRGTHLTHPKIWHCQAKKINIQSKDKTLVNLDGEQPGVLEGEFNVLPGIVRILLPSC